MNNGRELKIEFLPTVNLWSSRLASIPDQQIIFHKDESVTKDFSLFPDSSSASVHISVPGGLPSSTVPKQFNKYKQKSNKPQTPSQQMQSSTSNRNNQQRPSVTASAATSAAKRGSGKTPATDVTSTGRSGTAALPKALVHVTGGWSRLGEEDMRKSQKPETKIEYRLNAKEEKQQKTLGRVRALYKYEAQPSQTTDDEVELSINPGDIISVIAKHDDGWWEGMLNGN